MLGKADTPLWHVSELNFRPEVRSGMAPPKKIIVFDETLREGEETPGVTMSISDKVELARRLVDLGVTEAMIGYVGYIEELAEAANAIKRACPSLQLTGYVRVLSRDLDAEIEKTLACEVDWIDVNVPCSEYYLSGYGVSVGEVLDRSMSLITRLKPHGRKITYGPSDTSRADLDFVKVLCREAVKAGAQRVRVYDTLGVLNSEATRFWIAELKRTVGAAQLQYHIHDDFDMSVACTCAAATAGADVIDLSFNGLGDRAGNTPFEAAIVALTCLYGVDTGIRTEKLYEVAKYVEAMTGVALQRNRPITGQNTFIHESDSHILAVLSGRDGAIEPFSPQLVGQKRSLYFGSTTGRDSIVRKGELMGIPLDESQVDTILEAMKEKVRERGYAAEEQIEQLIRVAAI